MNATDNDKVLSALHSLDPSMAEGEWWQIAAALRSEGERLFEPFDQWSSGGKNYQGTQDCRAVWNAHPPKPGGKTIGTLFGMAMEAGWKFKPGKVPKAKPPAPPPPPAPAPTQAPTPPNPVYELQNIWQRAAPATARHPYCIAKGVNDPAMVAGLRVLPSTDSLRLKGHSMAGALLVPVHSPDGRLLTVQCIVQVDTKPDGSPVFEKPNLKGYKFSTPDGVQGFHTVGKIEAGQPVHIVEGIGAAWACYQATGGHASVVTFGVGNTKAVASTIQRHYPEARIVLVPDVGQEAQAQKTAKELGCAVARMPEGLPSNYDAWDALNDEDLPGAVALVSILESAAMAPKKAVEATGYEDDTEAPFLSEMALAALFAEECAARFRWSPGMDWMVNAGTHWERDDHLKRFNVVKAVCRGAATETDKAGLAAKLCSANTSSAVLSLARSEPGIVTPVAEWDKYPMLLNTPGDCYDLETGLPVSRTGLLFTQVTGIAPARMATPVWEKFISEVFDNDVEAIEFIQRLAGYCLTGSVREQKLFFLYGAGSNGKNVLLDVLKAIAGRYGYNLPSEALMSVKHVQHPTELASLQGKRLAISSEIEESAHWAEARIKQLTGDAQLTARFMRGDPFEFPVTHKHVLAGNFKPRLKGDDFAMQRRMVLVPFTQQFTGTRKDERLPEKLKAEYPGILAWAIEGARKWATDGLRIPTTVTESSKEYMAQQNDIELWIDECCNVGDGLRCKSSDLYASYANWKQRNGENAGSSKMFSQRLERKFTKGKSDGLMVFKGLQLKPEYQLNDYQNQSRGF